MAKIEKFEELRCWQQAREIVNEIYDILKEPQIKNEHVLSDQLKRAAISAMTNISEGFSRYHRKDFVRFLDYSQSSTQEIKSLVYILLDQKLIDQDAANNIQNKCDYCRASSLALIKYLNESSKKDNYTNEPGILYLSNDQLIISNNPSPKH